MIKVAESELENYGFRVEAFNLVCKMRNNQPAVRVTQGTWGTLAPKVLDVDELALKNCPKLIWEISGLELSPS